MSSSYTTYLVIADSLQVTTSTAGSLFMSYMPRTVFSGYYQWVGGVIYYPYNSLTPSSINGTGISGYYVAPLFGTGVSQESKFQYVPV